MQDRKQPGLQLGYRIVANVSWKTQSKWLVNEIESENIFSQLYEERNESTGRNKFKMHKIDSSGKQATCSALIIDSFIDSFIDDCLIVVYEHGLHVS